MSNEYVRGAVTGVGIVTIVGGLRELTGAFLARVPGESATAAAGDARAVAGSDVSASPRAPDTPADQGDDDRARP